MITIRRHFSCLQPVKKPTPLSQKIRKRGFPCVDVRYDLKSISVVRLSIKMLRRRPNEKTFGYKRKRLLTATWEITLPLVVSSKPE
jgi:hypothetical protein